MDCGYRGFTFTGACNFAQKFNSNSNIKKTKIYITFWYSFCFRFLRITSSGTRFVTRRVVKHFTHKNVAQIKKYSHSILGVKNPFKRVNRNPFDIFFCPRIVLIWWQRSRETHVSKLKLAGAALEAVLFLLLHSRTVYLILIKMFSNMITTFVKGGRVTTTNITVKIRDRKRYKT